MAKDKASFVVYSDLIHTIDHLSDTQTGKLFRLMLQYVNDKNPPSPKDKILRIAFEPIKRQLKRDLKEWEAKRSKRSESGKLGGIKSGESRRKRSKRSNASKNEANEADNVTVTVNVNDTVNVNVMEYDAEKIILENQIEFERIAMSSHKTFQQAKENLRDYHLYLQEKNFYPMSRRQIFAGFERWLRGEKRFTNGHKISSAGAKQLVESLKKDYASGE